MTEKEFTEEFAKESREDAARKYSDEIEKFYYRLLEINFYKIKALLNERGLQKVAVIDLKRENNENFGIEFSQKTWEAISEVWEKASKTMIKKIIDLYELDQSDLEPNNFLED
tara:strand:+ start:11492 stop:11830 length:339 start_codon:yes stop_codon:yes gene_type:complete